VLTASNSDSIGIFYYSGQVLVEEDEYYLAAFDSEHEYADFTAVPLRYLDRNLGARGIVVLDLCIDEASKRFQIRDQLPNALVSFDSCDPTATNMAIRIAAEIDNGSSLRSAINQLYDEEEGVQQKQRF
jgi:hypothetical protein